MKSIDPRTFEYSDTVWGDIFNHLKNAGFDVFSPGTKVGECTTPYVVVTVSTTTKEANYRTDKYLYTIICYVPKLQYSKLEPFVRSIRESMKELYPYVQYNGSMTPSFYDDTIKAHNISIDYKNYKLIS